MGVSRLSVVDNRDGNMLRPARQASIKFSFRRAASLTALLHATHRRDGHGCVCRSLRCRCTRRLEELKGHRQLLRHCTCRLYRYLLMGSFLFYFIFPSSRSWSLLLVPCKWENQPRSLPTANRPLLALVRTLMVTNSG